MYIYFNTVIGQSKFDWPISSFVCAYQSEHCYIIFMCGFMQCCLLYYSKKVKWIANDSQDHDILLYMCSLSQEAHLISWPVKLHASNTGAALVMSHQALLLFSPLNVTSVLAILILVLLPWMFATWHCCLCDFLPAIIIQIIPGPLLSTLLDNAIQVWFISDIASVFSIHAFVQNGRYNFHRYINIIIVNVIGL